MQSEPQLSAELEKRFREEFHIQSVKHNEYGITHIFPLDDEGRMLVPDVSDLELFLATALEEQRAEFVVELMTKINLIIDQSKEHSCRFNDGDSNCECYLEGLNRIKRQFSFEHKCGIVDKIKEMKSGVLPDARQRGYNQAIDDVLAILNGKETE